MSKFRLINKYNKKELLDTNVYEAILIDQIYPVVFCYINEHYVLASKYPIEDRNKAIKHILDSNLKLNIHIEDYTVEEF